MKTLATTESSPLIVRGMEKLLVDLEDDLEFLIAGTEAANGVYSRAIQAIFFRHSPLAQSHNTPCLPEQFLHKPCFHLL